MGAAEVRTAAGLGGFRRTRSNMLNEVLRHIERRERFVLTSHARPDGDAIGSALACSEILRSMGKQAQVVLSDGVPRIYQPLPFADTVLQASEISGEYEAAIVLECDSIQRTRLGGLEERFLISIDHHVSGRPFAHVNWIDPAACATGEMVFRLARQAGVPISPEIATCLYTAVLTDTGSFMFQGTNEHTFALARELVLAGADPACCARNIYFSHSTSKMRLLGAALSNLHREGPLAWIWVTREQMNHCGAIDEDCEGLVNYALAIQGVEVSAFFREMADGRYRVSLRSKGRLNVATVAERFGGGGHECASGCSLDGPLSVAVGRVLAQLRLGPSVQ
jgi:bifunctional oligoribonuclease and PAP phosphatase NrnA